MRIYLGIEGFQYPVQPMEKETKNDVLSLPAFLYI